MRNGLSIAQQSPIIYYLLPSSSSLPAMGEVDGVDLRGGICGGVEFSITQFSCSSESIGHIPVTIPFYPLW